MKVTDAMLGEHGAIYALFDHLERAVAVADESGRVREWASLLAAVLEPHARLEDELLLEPLLAATDEPAGPVEEMIREHEDVRSLLAEIREEEDLDRTRDLLLHVIQSARDHFAKEERMAVPMAERLMDGERLEELGGRWLTDRGVRTY